MSSPESRLAELKLDLPPAPKPMGVYKPCLTVGKFVYVSGHGPNNPDGSQHVGRVGADLTEEQGKAAARQVGLTMLASLRAHLGSLDKIGRVIKVLGMVNAAPDFGRHPEVINGCTDLFVEVFGEAGRPARSAVGMGSLPHGIAVEVEAIVLLRG